jgi:hypothetical protein
MRTNGRTDGRIDRETDYEDANNRSLQFYEHA